MTWFAIAGSALATYLVRAFAFKVALPSALPRGVVRYLDALPAAIIAALAGPAILVPNGAPTRGPELIAAIVQMKLRNPRFGCVRIGRQLSHAFNIEIDKDVEPTRVDFLAERVNVGRA